MGLEQLAPQDGGGTVRELMTWWLEMSSEGTPAHPKNLSTIENHLLEGKIADVNLAELTKGKIETFLDQKAKRGLSAQTVNHVRGHLPRALAGREPGPQDRPPARSETPPDFLRLERSPRRW